MVGFRKTWTFRGTFGDIELEIPRCVDPKSRDVSQAQLRALAHELKSGDLRARRVLLEIHAELRGQSPHVARGNPLGLDLGWARADAIVDDLLQAMRVGHLVARAKERRPVLVPLEDEVEPVLGPEPEEEAPPKSFVGITLVDQDGAPVPNRRYRLVPPDRTTRDGQLDSRGSVVVKELDPGNCQIICPYVEPHPELTHVVQQGEQISGIAETYGFDDYAVVWNHANNADLKALRQDPHVLQPGDSLYIPALEETPVANKPTGAKHTFTIQRSPLKLRVRLLDLRAKPVSGAAVTIASTALTTGDDGVVEAEVAKSAQAVPLTANDNGVDLAAGALNPADDTSDAGWKARLFNLGFLWDPMVADDDDEMVIAVEDFQDQYSLPLTGTLDDATKVQLLQVYGC